METASDTLCERPHPSRRAVLLGSGALFAWAYLPRFARAAKARDPRLVVLVLRGALDGLSTVAPVGDPDYHGLHGDIALALDGPHPAGPEAPSRAQARRHASPEASTARRRGRHAALCVRRRADRPRRD